MTPNHASAKVKQLMKIYEDVNTLHTAFAKITEGAEYRNISKNFIQIKQRILAIVNNSK